MGLDTTSPPTPFLSTNVVRVDPSGDDSTGTVGDLNKPFLTVQGAIDAIENGSYTNPVIDIGCNDYSAGGTLTTSLVDLTIKADRIAPEFGFNLADITMTGTGDPAVDLTLINVSVSYVDFTGGNGNLFLFNSAVFSVTSTGQLAINAPTLSGSVYGSISASSSIILFGLLGINDIPPSYATVTPGEEDGVTARYCLLDSVIGGIGADMTDSRFVNANPNPNNVTIHYFDILLNPKFMDFSTLPIGEPSESGKAWIDDTAGLNIVKVKLA